MSIDVLDERTGETHSFPDGATPQQIQEVMGRLNTDGLSADERDIDAVASNPLVRGAIGLGQLALGPLQLGANVGDRIAEQMGNEPVVGKYINEQQKKLRDMQVRGMRERGHESDFDAFGMAGAMAGGMAGLPAAAGGYAKRVMQGGALGTAMGMGAPVSDGDDYAETKQTQMEVGGGLGAVLPAMGPLLRGAANATSGMGKALYNKIRPAFEEADTTLGRGLKEVLGDKRDAVIQLLRANRNPLGQGSAGEVASPAGSSKFSAVQQVANKVDSDAHIDTIASQSAARGDALRTVAGKPGDIQVAEALRNSATAPMREIALMNAQFSAPGVDVSGVMGKVSALIADPSVKGGTATLAPLMKNIMEDLGALTNPSLSGKSPQINARALYAFRQDGLDGILEKFKTAQGGVPRRAAGLIVQIKDELDNAIEKAAGGGWKAYLKKYEDMSRSVDRLNVGKYMTDKLFPNGEEVLTSAADRSSQFSTLLREGTRTVKQATGSKQGRSLEETLTASQMRSVGNVKADLLRSKDFERLATAGSKGGSEAVSITDPTLPNALWREIMIANSALRSLGDAKEAAILARVAVVFKADPEKGFEELIGILESMPPEGRNVIMSALAKSAPKLGQLMERLNTTAPIGATRLVGES